MQRAVVKRGGAERLEVLLFPGGDFSQAFRVSERWGQSDGLRLFYRAQGLTTVYPSASGEVRALNGVDLDLCAGEMVVLLGAFSAPRDDTARELRNRDQKETLIIRASCAEVRTAQTRPALDDPWLTARL